MTHGWRKLLVARVSLVALALACVATSSWAAGDGGSEFKGKIAERYEDSQEWWPQTVPPAPKGAPNVVIILLDDVGFSQIGSFGGLSATPHIDALAAGGLRFNNFHTAALCSPSRASLMAGRFPHSIGLGSHALTAMGFPGYNAIVPPTAKSVAKILQQNGYVNYALGKWDHTPLYEVSQVGPFERWPSDEGFDHFYGFMAADADQYRTLMFQDHAPIEPWKGQKDYHNSTDLADKAIEYITGHVSLAPDRPFMVFFAPGAMHSPHQAPPEYIAKYRGQFDMGWDRAREMILEKQKKLGIVPADAKLTERIEAIPAWDSLGAEEKKLYARQMEVFAAMLEHVDHEIGRIVATLERVGVLDDTLILVTSDNGASGEGGLAGTFNETYVINAVQTPFETNMRYFDEWGGPSTYPHYHAGWAMAGNTPFRYFKQAVHRGGIQDPLIIHWPKGIQGRGGVRSQYHHIADIAPTLLDILGLEVPDEIGGVKQQPMDGVSMRYAFNDAKAPDAKKVQYYEMFGNRAIWADGWKAVTLHANRLPWDINVVQPFDQDEWQLYHVARDFSEADEVADEHPEKLEELKQLFDDQARKYHVYPLYDDMMQRIAKQHERMFGDRMSFTYYFPGAVRIAEKASPPIKGRTHTITTQLDLKGGEKGVIVACGGFTGGYTLFVKNGRLHYDYNYLDGVHYLLESPPLAMGRNEVKFEFVHAGNFAGTGELFVNGKSVDKVHMPKTHPATFSLSETFDVGRDNGTQVSTLYAGDFPYTGTLDKVVFQLGEFPKAEDAKRSAAEAATIEGN
ncbi:MAG: sulfatase-like hydrolase/transferase [Gemmatimonadota bacterium]